MCSYCFHYRKMHYDGPQGWCNTQGCQCPTYNWNGNENKKSLRSITIKQAPLPDIKKHWLFEINK